MHWTAWTALSVIACTAALGAQVHDFTRGIKTELWRVSGAATATRSGDAAALSELIKRRPGPKAAVLLSRALRLGDVAEIRLRFEQGDPGLAGIGIGLSKDEAFYRVATAGDRMFHLHAAGGGLKPLYGGRRWQQPGPHEIRISVERIPVTDAPEGAALSAVLKTHVVLPDGLPRSQDGYTREVPATWLQGEATLTVGCRFDDEDVGSARLLGVSIYHVGEETPVDVEHCTTVAGSLAKYQQLRAGKLTPALKAAMARVRAEQATSRPSPGPGFDVQMWDGQKLATLGWTPQSIAEIATVYTLIQSRYFRPEQLALVRGRGLGAAVYVVTRQPEYFEGLSGSPHVVIQAPYKGRMQTKTNFFSGDFIELSAKQTILRLAPLMRSGLVRRVMLDSEYKVGIGTDPLTRAAAAADGVAEFEPYRDGPDEPYTRVVPDDDPHWQCLRWVYAHKTKAVSSRTIGRMIRTLWPGVEVTTDPLNDYAGLEEFADLDVVQHWVRVHYAPRNPRSAAYYAERGRVHVRASDGKKEVHLGPQLGRGDRATPRHMLSEACWLAVAFGCRGVTHWGFQAIRQKEDGAWSPGGRAAWATLQRLRRELYDRHAELLLSWTPRPRRLAMLVSRADLAYASGGRGYEGHEAAENVYRAMLSIGEPADIVYDVEVLDGRLRDYKALVVPSLYVANRSLVERIEALAAGGGTVIAHGDSVLAGRTKVKALRGDLTPVYKDYLIRKQEPGTLRPDQYAAFLDALGAAIRRALPFEPRVGLDSPRVIANLMTDGRDEYLVLVNDHRRYGPEREALGAPMMLDEGVPTDVTVRLEGASGFVDLDGGARLRADDGHTRVRLGPGWGKILRIER